MERRTVHSSLENSSLFWITYSSSTTPCQWFIIIWDTKICFEIHIKHFLFPSFFKTTLLMTADAKSFPYHFEFLWKLADLCFSEGLRVMITDPLPSSSVLVIPDHPERGRRHSMAHTVSLKFWSPLAGVPNTTYIWDRKIVFQVAWIHWWLEDTWSVWGGRGRVKGDSWVVGGVSCSDFNLGSMVFCTFLIHKLE